LSHGFRFQWEPDRVKSRARVCPQDFRELRLADYVHHENDEYERKKSARYFDHTPGSRPTAPFFVVENWLAFRHSGNPS
jgi:hypothetical protein